MKVIKRITSALCAAAIAAAAVPALPANNAKAADKTAQQILDEMGLGWNLGNTFDSWGDLWWIEGGKDNYETGWGNPKVTKEFIKFVHDSGFSSIRIPVSWHDHMSGDNYTIDQSWMNRVKEVVDYAYDEGMYVIINIHHDNEINSDGRFFYPTNQYKEQSEKYVKDVWTQISEVFKDYDQHLIFETLNEPRLVGDPGGNEWWFSVDNPSDSVKTAVSIINTLNQDAVDVIRASGGNNTKRLVMCPGYDASLDGATVNGFSLPNDSSNMVGVSIHAYAPYDFAMNTEGGSRSDYSQDMQAQLNYFFDTIQNKVFSRGYVCYIGEFGATNKNNDTDRCKWAEDYTSQAKALGIPVLLWDNNAADAGAECYGLINREANTIYFPNLLASLTKAYPMPEGKAGDANGDGVIDLLDVMLMQQHIAKWDVDINVSNADVDGDNEVTITDVMLVQQYIANWDVVLV